MLSGEAVTDFSIAGSDSKEESPNNALFWVFQCLDRFKLNKPFSL